MAEFAKDAAEYPFDFGPVALDIEVSVTGEALLWLELAWTNLFGFCHEEACECAKRAKELDPSSAIVSATIAHAYAHNYNDGSGISLHQAAKHAQEALSLLNESSTPLEVAIVNAVQSRFFPVPGKGDCDARKKLDATFRHGLRQAYQAHPNSFTAYLLAESIMNLRPWCLWNRTDPLNIVPANADTTELVLLLEKALEQDPNHPGKLESGSCAYAAHRSLSHVHSHDGAGPGTGKSCGMCRPTSCRPVA